MHTPVLLGQEDMRQTVAAAVGTCGTAANVQIHLMGNHRLACWIEVFSIFELRVQVKLVGRQRLVLDLSCRWRDGSYWIVTDRWQRFTEAGRIRASLPAPAVVTPQMHAPARLFAAECSQQCGT